MPGIYEADKKSLIDILTPDEVELRDKFALEAMKQLMVPGFHSAKPVDELSSIAMGLAGACYVIAGQMIRARKEVA